MALMLVEEEKNASLSDINNFIWVHKCFRKRTKVNTGSLYKELAHDEMKFISILEW